MIHIGIIGAGNIGLTFAKLLVSNKIVDKEHSKISYKGSLETLSKLKENDLEDTISTNETIFQTCDIIFLTIKPKDYSSFHTEGNVIKKDAIVISTVAGYPLSKLKLDLQHDTIYDVMPSGPETLIEGTGICALYPINANIATLMESLQIKVFSVSSEKAFYLFTTALCLPAAFLQMNRLPNENENDYFIEIYYSLIPNFSEVLAWAASVTPFELTNVEKQTIIKNMSTSGGITENLVHHIVAGDPITEAFAKALTYCEQLSGK
jgi:hypothetical protein